eukprot:8918360-Pyramimonas_sp.AAC.1
MTHLPASRATSTVTGRTMSTTLAPGVLRRWPPPAQRVCPCGMGAVVRRGQAWRGLAGWRRGRAVGAGERERGGGGRAPQPAGGGRRGRWAPDRAGS